MYIKERGEYFEWSFWPTNVDDFKNKKDSKNKDDLKNEDNPKQDLETILVFLAAQTNLLIFFAKAWDFQHCHQNQLCYTNTNSITIHVLLLIYKIFIRK